jgi:HK97 family phage major capsid protein
MELLMKQLAESVKNLQDTVTAKFATPDPKVAEAEKDALVKTVLEKMSALGLRPPEPKRKMVFSMGDEKVEENTKRVGFTDFLKAVARKDRSLLSELSLKSANGQSEGTDADGGYLVPVEYETEIIKLEKANSVARRLARIFPMGSLTRKVNRQLTDPTISWIGEAVNKPKTKATWEPVTQTAKKMACIIPVTEELLEDNNVSLDRFLAECVARAIGREEDRIAFVGDVSGIADPFNGIWFSTGVNNVALDGATVKFSDFVNLMMGVEAPYRARGSFLLSSTLLGIAMKMADDQGRPIWSSPVEGAPGRILGKPYEESDMIPDTLGTTATNGTDTGAIFGDFGGLWMSDRLGLETKASDSASDANAGAGSAFLQDEIWFRFRKRLAITVARPVGFSKMAVPAA